MLPFTREQFLGVFAEYNASIWPVPVIAYVLGLAALAMILYRPRSSDRIASGIVAAMWIWTGIAYHVLHFSAINPAAYLFGALFAVEGLYIAFAGVLRNTLHFRLQSNATAWTGLSLILYSMVVYPLIGIWSGHAYPQMPMFGVTPCPVTIFTFGMFMLTIAKFSWWLMAIPFVWSLVGGSASALLNVPQDWILLASGFVAVPLLALRDRHRRIHPSLPAIG